MHAGAKYLLAASQLGVLFIGATVLHVMFADPSVPINYERVGVVALMGIAGIVAGAHWGE